jgi:hypothetical protein
MTIAQRFIAGWREPETKSVKRTTENENRYQVDTGSAVRYTD